MQTRMDHREMEYTQSYRVFVISAAIVLFSFAACSGMFLYVTAPVVHHVSESPDGRYNARVVTVWHHPIINPIRIDIVVKDSKGIERTRTLTTLDMRRDFAQESFQVRWAAARQFQISGRNGEFSERGHFEIEGDRLVYHDE